MIDLRAMRIAVDARSLAAPTGRGVSHYAESLLGELARRYPEDEWVLLQMGRRAWRPSRSLRRRNVTVRHRRLPNKFLNASFVATGMPSLRSLAGDVDALFMPNLGFLPRLGGVPLVLTVHDLSFETYPQFYSPRERFWHAAVGPRSLVGKASRVLAVSDQTEREVVRTYGTQRKRITVAPPGIDAAYRPPPAREIDRIRRKYRLPRAYFLYVGAYEPRKNLPLLLDGYARARTQGLAAELVLVGPGTGHAAERARRAGAMVLGYVPEQDKAGLYGGALAVTLLSRHEGFGLPPLEALACAGHR
ncbi:MAG: glycosyltransferase family 4 protein [bacterium]|nr:glycosyltransferase family 4 protein [bacterium]